MYPHRSPRCTMEIVQKLLHVEPNIVGFHIIPYTYEPQPATLMRDIRNYRETSQLIRSIYRNYWLIAREEEEPEDQNWLINDLFGFGNNGIPTGHAYIDHFRNLWFRSYTITINDEFDHFIRLYERKGVSTQINMFWAILTLSERKLFIQRSLYNFNNIIS